MCPKARDGSFVITSQKTNSKLGRKINLEFKVTQKGTSIDVLYALVNYFDCGTVVINNRLDNTYKYHVTNLTDLLEKVIPHFDSYPLVTSKALRPYRAHQDFKQVAHMKKQKLHLNSSTPLSRGGEPEGSGVEPVPCHQGWQGPVKV